MNPQDLAKKYGATYTPPPSTNPADMASRYGATYGTQPPERPLFGGTNSKIGGAVDELSQGVAKGIFSTVKGASDLGGKIADQSVGRFMNLFKNNSFKGSTSPSAFNAAAGGDENARSLTEANTPLEKVGKTAEQIGEFFIPSSAASKAESSLNILSKGIKSPLLASLFRIGTKSAVQGLAAGTVEAVQSGGDLKKTLATAGTAGLIRGGFAVIGEGARALKIPERVYSVIFKNSKSDMLSELKSDALIDWQRKNPAQFQEFVDKGLVRVEGGVPQLNDTLAEKALDAGLKGSFKSMAGEVFRGSVQAEDDAQRILGSYKGTVDVSEPQFVKVLKQVGATYEDVGFGEIASQADDLANRISQSGGKVDGLTALELRRFLDRMRIASSFDKAPTKLSLTQSNFKTLADTVRGRISGISAGDDAVGDSINKWVTTFKNYAADGDSAGLQITPQQYFQKTIEEAAAQAKYNGASDAASKLLQIDTSKIRSFDELQKVMTKTAAVKNIGSVMSNYSFYIDAIDAIAREAAKRGNSQILGMIDSLFLGGAAVSSSPTGILTIGLLRRMIQSPSALTRVGQFLANPNLGTKASGALGAFSSRVSNAALPQTSQQ